MQFTSSVSFCGEKLGFGSLILMRIRRNINVLQRLNYFYFHPVILTDCLITTDSWRACFEIVFSRKCLSFMTYILLKSFFPLHNRAFIFWLQKVLKIIWMTLDKKTSKKNTLLLLQQLEESYIFPLDFMTTSNKLKMKGNDKKRRRFWN